MNNRFKKYINGPQIVICMFLSTSLLTLTSCATTLDQDRLTFMAESASAMKGEKPAILATASENRCEEIAHKRVTYGLFSLPFNELEASDFKEHNYRAYRFRTEIRPMDVLYTTLGFMFSFITRTVTVEGCQSKYTLVDGAYRERVKELERLEKTVTSSPVPVMLLPDRLPENGGEFVTVYFPFNSQKLNAGEVRKITNIVRLFERAGKDGKILLIGHSDSKGDNIPNLNVALQRALRVREALKKEGVSESNVLITSASDYWNRNNSKQRKRQRRVDVILLRSMKQLSQSVSKK